MRIPIKLSAGLFFLLSLTLLYSNVCRSQSCSPYFVATAYKDTYYDIADLKYASQWGPYNVHDPCIIKEGDWYYIYSTDVGLGTTVPAGIQIRKSTDLVNWTYVGRAFNGVPSKAVTYLKTVEPTYQATAMWAPYVVKYNDTYRLYYVVPANSIKVGYIGLATSSSAGGPWTDQGLVLAAPNSKNINSIDPTIVIDPNTGQHWMGYGSYVSGLYIVELDPETGFLKTSGDYGTKIANRLGSITTGTFDGNFGAGIEAPEIIYNPELKAYFLFVSYDWLEDTYNVRVGKSTSPNGPYYDMNGAAMTSFANNVPMIQAPYQFNGHGGWQGTGHCGVINDNGNYYMVNQGRPSTDKYNMDLHVRKIFWLNGWPVLSPERYTAEPSCDITSRDLQGEWEHMPLVYGGTDGLHSTSTSIILDSTGSINSDTLNTWKYNGGILSFKWNSGEIVDSLIVTNSWDWENKKPALVYTGLRTSTKEAVWGKQTTPVHDKATNVVTVISAITSNSTKEVNAPSIYSQPGKIIVKYSQAFSHAVSIEIYSLLGNTIVSIQTQSADNELDTRRFAKGIYIVKTNVGGNVFTSKVEVTD